MSATEPTIFADVVVGGRHYRADLSRGTVIAWPLGGDVPDARAWRAPPTTLRPVTRGTWVGDVRAGSVVNFATLALAPHGAGTHTESYAHIAPLTDENAICAVAPRGFFCAELVDLPTARGSVVDFGALRARPPVTSALIARALPRNGRDVDHSGTDPAYFRAADMAWLAELGVEHFVTDLPSLDREDDGGALAAHRAFWKYPHATRTRATVTELARLNQALAPGLYLLSINVLPVRADASPSVPTLYALRPQDRPPSAEPT